jgi:hypothetical protein
MLITKTPPQNRKRKKQTFKTMVEVIRSTTHKAKNEYNDDGWEYIRDWVDEGCPIQLGRCANSPTGHLTFKEARYLVLVRNRSITPHKILPGQVYISQFNKMDGYTYTFRTKIEFYDLCRKYNLWPEE